MKEQYDENMLQEILNFLASVDIAVHEKELNGDCILPGCDIQGDAIFYDKNRLKYPGDLLHEAGHLAMTPETKRPLIGTDKMDSNWPSDSDEIGAILWSYGAIHKMGIDPKVVFHAEGYKGESEWLIEQFSNEIFIGLPLLEWLEFCNSPEKAKDEKTAAFPHMLKWLR